MPAPAFVEPIEKILNGNCKYDYYNSKENSFSKERKSRICRVTLHKDGLEDVNVIMMIFTIRNQNGKWKIHSEGRKRMDPGSTVPVRNNAINIAKTNGWKYVSIGISGVEDANDDISKYVVAIESYEYGESTVYDLSSELEELKNANYPDFYRTHIELDGRVYSLAFLKREKLLDYLEIFDDRSFERTNTQSENIEQESRTKKSVNISGENILLYGVPGSGKSFAIDQRVGNAKYERVVFHPDYSYSDFVGQIMPRLKPNKSGEEKLTYEFVPGPFTKALKEAHEDENQIHYLIIEEINRGNAPAIFGDIFQLLDREEDGSGKYSITNYEIANIVYEDESHPVRIPSNLTILATMNTSDQNVFTLDTAFQRRWNMEYIPNKIDEAIHATKAIEGSEITWGQFAGVINDAIIEYNRELASSEDKQLGAYFVKESELTKEKFPKKALKYLWDDVFKLEREKVFASDINSIGMLMESYDNEVKKGNDPIRRVMDVEVYERMMDMSAVSVEDAIKYETFSTISNDEEN